MKKSKKLMALLLAAGMALSVAGCSSSDTGSSSSAAGSAGEDASSALTSEEVVFWGPGMVKSADRSKQSSMNTILKKERTSAMYARQTW